MVKTSKLIALFVLSTSLGAVSFGQEKAEPKIRVETVERTESIPAIQTFERIFEDGGSYLGVQTQEITKENFSKFGLSSVRGVAVEKVMDDSPAKQAGLQDGDVIVRFNGEEVSSYRKLTRLISETAPDHQAKLTVVRGGNEREITVTMGKRQIPKFEMGNFEMAVPAIPRMPESDEKITKMRMIKPGEVPRTGEFAIYPPTFNGDVLVWQGEKDGANFVFGSTRQIGVGVSDLTKQLGNYFGVADGKGVLINNVNENSPAAKAGLKAGDVIVEVEGKAVSNTMELIRGISEKKEGEVTLTILRDRNRQTVKVTPEKMKEGDSTFRTFGQPNGAVAPQVRVTAPTRTVAPARVRTIVRVL